MATATTQVTQLSGQAWVRASDGALTPLQQGMRIPSDADVVTATGASVQLQSNGQPPITVGGDRDIQLSAETAQPDLDPSTAAAAVPADPDVARVLAALEDGADPFADLEATAAVLDGGSGGDGGSSFTRLASVIETTTPLGLEYPRPTFPRPEEIRLAGQGASSAAELTDAGLLDTAGSNSDLVSGPNPSLDDSDANRDPEGEDGNLTDDPKKDPEDQYFNRAPELIGAGLLDQVNNDSDLIGGLNVGQYFIDPDGHPLTFTASNLPPGLAINPVTGIIEGTLDSSASQGGLTGDGVYNVVITATDPYGASIDLPFTWTTNNPPPVATADENTTEENTVVEGNVLEGDPITGLGRDVDPDGDKLTVTEITNSRGDQVSAGNPIAGVNANGSKGGGSFTINPDGSYKFDPGTDFDYLAVDESTTTTVSYQISDGDGGFDQATLTITVTGSNDAPVIKVAGTDDQATVTELEDLHKDENKITHTKEGVIRFDDADDSDDTHTIKTEAAPVAGQSFLGNLSAALNPDKTNKSIDWTFEVDDKDIDYLAAGETLTQKYIITIDDGKGGTVEQAVTITIVGTNDAPIIDVGSSAIAGAVTEDDAGQTTAGGTLVWGDADNRDTHTWEVVANKDVDGNATGQTNGQYGKLEINDSGVWVYTLNNDNPAVDSLPKDGKLTDTITVLVDDGNGGTDEQVITITITGTNDAPVLNTQDGDYIAAGIVKESGYQVPATLEAKGQLIATDVDTGDTLTWSFDATDKAKPTETMAGVYGSITLNSVTGEWTYTLNDSATVTDKLNNGDKPEEVFTAYVSDGKGGIISQNITVTVQGTNDAPVAVADTGSVSESGVLTKGGNPNATFVGTLEATGNVLSNDTDVDSAHENLKVTEVSFTYQGVTTAGTVGSALNGTYGKLQLNENGTYTYTLDDQSDVVQKLKQGDEKRETFSYKVVDEHGAPHETTLTITVTGTNDQPMITTAADDSKGVVTERGAGKENEPSTVKGVLSATDVDADYSLSWSLQSNTGQTVEPAAGGVTKINGQYGSLTLDKETGEWTYELDNARSATQALKEGEQQKETFTARVTDEHGAYAEQNIVITVNGTNDAPIAKDDTVSFKEDLPNPADPNQKSSRGNVLLNDIDPDDDIKVTTFKIDGVDTDYRADGVAVDIGGIGTFSMDETGNYVFTPKEHYSGDVPVITYTIQEARTDGEPGLTDSATLKFDITPVADAPELAKPDNVATKEDVSIALGLKAPVVTDKIDHNGAGKGDNPELLGLISLSGIPEGVQLLDSDGNVLWTSAGKNSLVTIDLSNGHENGNGHIAGVNGDLTLTKEQFESLVVNPKEHDGDNFTVKVSVDSYEVDTDGNPLTGIVPANTTVNVAVDVQAVTDDVALTFVGGGTQASFTINEDKRFNLTKELQTAFEDLDGSEQRYIVISELPAGSKVIANNSSIKINAEGNFVVHATKQTGDINSFPKIEVLPPSNFSGDIEGIKVTLIAQDTDTDSTHSIASKSAEVTLDLYVNPVAGDVTVKGVSGNEDTAIKFLAGVNLTDKDGSEVITSFIIKGVPQDWVVRDGQGNVINGLSTAGSEIKTYYFAPEDGVVNLADYKGWTITPPAHSSKDATFKVDVTTVDTSVVNGETVTHTSIKTDQLLKVTVKPVAEKVVNGKTDLTMTPGTTYENVAGKEDQWFDIKQDGFNLKDGWFNQDGKPTDGSANPDSKDGGTEETFAILTPVLKTGASGDTIIGSQFSYKDPSKVSADNPEGYVVLTFNGRDGIEIPMEFLDSVQFKAPAYVSGTFDIKVQAKTVDTDPDDDYTSIAISGEAWLKGIVIEPVADKVTLGIGGAHGKEDKEIPLIIRPSSDDPSETFTVTISGIPQGATLNYGGKTYAPDANGLVKFEDFDSGKKLTITPPEHSDVDFTLNVNAASVDTSDGKTDVNALTNKEILVRIDGVADEAIVTFNSTPLNEDAFGIKVAGKDKFDNTIKLSDIINAQMVDADGSEILTFKITGLPEGFGFEGAGVTFMGGSGVGREWLLTEDQLNNAAIKVPEHYSGKLPGTLTAITTETGSGDSWTGAPQEWDVTITPSPESDMVSSTVVVEDTLTKLNFVTDIGHGDKNEVVSTLWILASDVDGKDFALFLGKDGNKTLADMAADTNSGVTIEGGYYKLTDDIGNVYVKPGANFSGDLTLTVKYEVTDYAEDASGVYTTSEIKQGSHTIAVTPVTDDVGLELSSADPLISSRGEISVGITLSKKPDTAAGNTPDYDGSEQFTQVVISGVPNGMLVEGLKVADADLGKASFLGNGKWLISIPTDQYPKFNGPINGEVMFKGTANMANSSGHNVGIKVDTKDGDDGAIKSATIDWNFDINVEGGGGGPADKSSVNVTWEKKPDFNGVEDNSFKLNQAFSGIITQTGANGELVAASVGANFTILLNLSPGSTLTQPDGTKILPITIDGEEVWVLTGKGQSQLDDYLSNTTITPPENLNDNAQDKFQFQVDFTGHLDNGKQSEEQFGKGEDDFLSLQPVTDKPGIDIAFAAVGPDGQPTGTPQEGSDVAITLNVRNDADIGSVFGDSVYIKVPTGTLAGGELKEASSALQTSTVDSGNAMGLEAGEYFVVNLPEGSTQIDLTYTPPAGKEYTSGDLSLEAWVQSKEAGADNWETGGSGLVNGKVEAINNGFEFSVGHKDSNDVWVDNLVIGKENQSGNSVNAIKLGITGSGLVDTDGSEQAITSKLASVPNGFLVYYKVGTTLVLATNAGKDGDGNNTWLLPMDNNALPEIFVQPPQNWGGTVNDIQLSVFSGEEGKETWGDSTTFDLDVNPVADGILSATANSAFGKEGDIIQLNLNIVMKDDQQAGDTDQFVENVTLTLSGMGEHAAFYIGDQLWTGSTVYENGVYTLSGLTQDQLDTLGFIQAAGAVESTIAYTAKTVETSIQDPDVTADESEEVNGDFKLDIFEQTSADGDDTLLYGGGLLDGGKGEDTVWLRFGEDLDFTDITVSDNISNIEILDLTKQGYDHRLINLGVHDVANMTDNRNVLKINANEGDTILFKQGDWTFDEDRSSTGDYDIYTGKTTDDDDVEVHTTKNVDGLILNDDIPPIDSLMGDDDTSLASFRGAGPSLMSIETDDEQQNLLADGQSQQDDDLLDDDTSPTDSLMDDDATSAAALRGAKDPSPMSTETDDESQNPLANDPTEQNIDDLLLDDDDAQSIDSLMGDESDDPSTPTTGGAGTAPVDIEIDHEQQNQLINDLIQQGKLDVI